MGAVTLTKDLDRPRRVSRHVRMQTGTVTMSASYATGGDTGMDPIPGGNYTSLDVEPVGGRVFEFDKTNKKLKAMQGDYPNAAANPLIEVPNATNLSAVVTRYVAMAKA